MSKHKLILKPLSGDAVPLGNNELDGGDDRIEGLWIRIRSLKDV